MLEPARDLTSPDEEYNAYITRLYEEHGTYVQKLIRKWLPNECGRADVEDVSQDVWLAVHSFSWQCHGDPKYWIASIAVHKTLIFARARKARRRDWRRTTSLSQHDGDLIRDPRADSAFLAMEGEQRDALVVMHSAIERLPRQMAAAIRLYLEGYKDDEAGKILGCHENTVRTNWYRGRRILKRRMRL